MSKFKVSGLSNKNTVHVTVMLDSRTNDILWQMVNKYNEEHAPRKLRNVEPRMTKSKLIKQMIRHCIKETIE